jgi:hypothetical protein
MDERNWDVRVTERRSLMGMKRVIIVMSSTLFITAGVDMSADDP